MNPTVLHGYIAFNKPLGKYFNFLPPWCISSLSPFSVICASQQACEAWLVLFVSIQEQFNLIIPNLPWQVQEIIQSDSARGSSFFVQFPVKYKFVWWVSEVFLSNLAIYILMMFCVSPKINFCIEHERCCRELSSFRK